MYEWIFVLYIVLNGVQVGLATFAFTNQQLCEQIQSAVEEDSANTAPDSSIQTSVSECERRVNI